MTASEQNIHKGKESRYIGQNLKKYEEKLSKNALYSFTAHCDFNAMGWPQILKGKNPLLAVIGIDV